MKDLVSSVVAFILYLSVHQQHYDDSKFLLIDGLLELIERSRAEE